ncbi:hypothetical protein Tco_1007421 [Tanacetum coccineum]
MPSLYLPKSESYVYFVHPLEDAKQYSNPIASLTLYVASAKTTRYGYINNHKKTVKNGQTRTRETEEHKRSQRCKAKARKS